MLRIEPLGTDVVLPALFLGFNESVGDHSARPLDGLEHAVAIDQQAGGLAMSYPSAVGYLLRLSDNMDIAFQDPTDVIRGFRAMAEDPKLGVLSRDYPALRPLAATRGDLIPKEDLAALDRCLSQYFALPRLESGLEAFLQFAECNLAEYFVGWQAAKPTLAREPRRLYGPTQDTYIDGSNVSCIDWSETVLIDAGLLHDLSLLGTKEQLGPPQAFLLWENSD